MSERYTVEEKFEGWSIVLTENQQSVEIIKGIDFGKDGGEKLAKKIAALLNSNPNE